MSQTAGQPSCWNILRVNPLFEKLAVTRFFPGTVAILRDIHMFSALTKRKCSDTKDDECTFLWRVIIQVQSFIIKCLSFRWVSFVQGYELCLEKLCTWVILSFFIVIYWYKVRASGAENLAMAFINFQCMNPLKMISWAMWFDQIHVYNACCDPCRMLNLPTGWTLSGLFAWHTSGTYNWPAVDKKNSFSCLCFAMCVTTKYVSSLYVLPFRISVAEIT